jgi:hypothetical protein
MAYTTDVTNTKLIRELPIVETPLPESGNVDLPGAQIRINEI